MKYAITGPAGRIFRILDAPTAQTKEITDEQATTVNSSDLPMFLLEGELKTQTEAQEINRAKRQAERIAAMTPEELAVYQAQQAAKAAYDVAAAAFEALPKGVQIMWGPTRAAVAAAILKGDFAEAKEILETTKPTYEGAETDRQIFLDIFNQFA